MKKNALYLMMLSLVVLTVASCKKKDPVIPNEEEVITTLKYTLTPDGGGDVVVLVFKDLDGDGGDAPEITGGTLTSNTTYNGTLELLNETETPAEDITAEIKAEDVDHQFFFSSTGLDDTISYNDTDANNKPVGLKSIFSTGNPATGELMITLRHEPNKSAAGVEMGDITNAGGETDIEVSFPVTVQ